MEEAESEATRLRRELDQARRIASQNLGQKQKELHETLIQKDTQISIGIYIYKLGNKKLQDAEIGFSRK